MVGGTGRSYYDTIFQAPKQGICPSSFERWRNSCTLTSTGEVGDVEVPKPVLYAVGFGKRPKE